ncbi:MAG: cation:proton antiporter [Desulfovibrio sp.]|uniref:cation:proton antiporter domain-containing protein n=1 Tax=Desulfovibrio sp. 7SRBS1 TaxID=3378064 RepID=UPI003B405321
MELAILGDMAILLALAVAVTSIFHTLRLPVIVGYLLTGVLAGPHGLHLIAMVHQVETMAEVGVVLLMFTIGADLSFGELMRLKKPVFLGGMLQVGLCIGIFGLMAAMLFSNPSQAVFVGCLIALSSTAIVLKLLNQRAELESPHGRMALSFLIFQDLAIVPMILITPFLAGTQPTSGMALLVPLLKAAGLVGALFLLSRRVIPAVLGFVVRTRSREMLLLTTLGLCLGIAYFSWMLGLSLSLGAFMAGLIMSESKYSLSALEGILPLRDVFISLFFISMGMLLNIGFLAHNLPKALLAFAAILLVKPLLSGLPALLLGYPARTAIITGLALAQIGEFSFVLAKEGLNLGLVQQDGYQLFLAASILTMCVTPVLVHLAPKLADTITAWPFMARFNRLPTSTDPDGAVNEKYEKGHHLIIVGFGVGGRHLARTARQAGIDYVILETNPDTVREAAAAGEPILYGDAAYEDVLRHVGAEKARALVIVISEPASVRRITDTARSINPCLHIVARTRFLSEIGPLKELGANDIVPEELETSVEIFARVLAKYLIPRQDIERMVADVRNREYSLLVDEAAALAPLHTMQGLDIQANIATLRVEKGAPLEGKTLGESDLRNQHGLSVVAVSREGKMIPNPGAEEELKAGDIAYVFGQVPSVTQKAWLFREAKKDSEAKSSS